MKKVIVIGVIALFIGVGFQPAFANDVSIGSSRVISNSIMENHPPYTPSNYTPCGGVSENIVNLSWDGGDPDPEDSVYYDVFFDDVNPPLKVITIGPYPANQTWIEYSPVELECYTHYYWYIFAYDEHNDCAMGLICSLLLICENQPPNPPMIYGPTNGKVGVVYEFSFSTSDPEGQNTSFYIDWGDGTSDGWTSYVESGQEIIYGHIWYKPGDYFVGAKAKDIYDKESDWTYLCTSISKNNACNFNLLGRQLERFLNTIQRSRI